MNITLYSAAYLYDAFRILSDSVTIANTMDTNFTQIRQSCDALKEWQYSSTFQAILTEVMYNNKITLNLHYEVNYRQWLPIND